MHLHFGALCDPISKQLEEQGLKLSDDDCKMYQRIADAITFLFLHRIITDSSKNTAHEKLMKLIVKKLQEGI